MAAEDLLQESINEAIRIFEQQRLFALSNSPNYVTMEADLQGAVPDDARQDVIPLIRALRNATFGFPGLAPGMIASFLPAYQRILGTPETDVPTILFRIFEHMADNSLTVKSRGISFGSPVAGGSNIGNGTLVRLTKDRYNFNIENGAAEDKTFECIADEHTNGGTRWQEQFEYRGDAVPRNAYPNRGQGGRSALRCLSIQDSQRFVINPGFEQYDSSNGFTGWNVTNDVANVTRDQARYYKDVLPSTTTPASATFGASDKIYQTFSTQQIRWNPFVPLYAQIAWMRRGSATGTLKLKIGSKTVSVDVSTGTNDEWNILRWPAATPDQDCWQRNWNTTDAQIEIEMDTLATGTVLVDDLIIAPYTQIDGTWYVLTPGTSNSNDTTGPAIPFLRDDIFTFTDSDGADAVVQRWMNLAFAVYLPHTTGTPTWSEPS